MVEPREKQEIGKKLLENEIWVKHYSSNHEILVVGDGDFSFSLCLANAFGSGCHIVATSLDSYDVLIGKYKNAKSNLEELQELGAYILHGVDATRMKFHTDLKMRKFNRIVFNFPHAGFHGKEVDPCMIRKHRMLVQGFLSNANGMLRMDGEVHISHKSCAPYCRWNIEELALKSSLVLIELAPFKIEDYPNYEIKRGDGARSDATFHLGVCKTFKFRFHPTAKKISKATAGRFSDSISLQINGDCVQMGRWSITFNDILSETSSAVIRDDITGHKRLSSDLGVNRRRNSECLDARFKLCFDGKFINGVDYAFKSWDHHREGYMAVVPETARLPQGDLVTQTRFLVRNNLPYHTCLTSEIGLNRHQFSNSVEYSVHTSEEYVRNAVPSTFPYRITTEAWDFGRLKNEKLETSHLLQANRHHLQYHLPPSDRVPSRASFAAYMDDFPGHRIANEFAGNSRPELEIRNRVFSHTDYSLHEARNHNLTSYVAENPSITLAGDIYMRQELKHLIL